MSNHKKIKLKKAPELNQKTKDSLQSEAFKYGKAFYSPKHKVNVDPEDGVLSNRVFYKDGSELKYESIDKPFDENNSAPTNFSTPFMAKSPLKETSIVQEDQKNQGTPWSKYDSDDIAANKGSGKPLPKQYFKGQRVYPNENDAFQTEEQAQQTEDLENTNN